MNTITNQRICRSCNRSWPLTREYFGSTPSGGHRYQCRLCVREVTKRWAKANPERLHQRERARQKRNAGFSITSELKSRLLSEQGHRCGLCGVGIRDIGDCDVDHLQPLAKGGSNDIVNLVAAHRQCNKEKAAKTLRAYAAWRRLNRLPESTFDSPKIRQALGLL